MVFDNRLASWLVRLGVVCVGVVAVSAGPVGADTIGLSQENSQIELDPHSQDGLLSWAVDGENRLFQEWFWIRTDQDGAETPLDALPLLHHEADASGVLHVLYGNADGSVELVYGLTGGASGSGESRVDEWITITNTREESVNLSLFAYTDLDVSADGLDTAALIAPKAISQHGGSSVVTVTSLDQTPTRWEISPYFNLLDQLDDGAVTNLANANLSSGPGDLTHAFQYDVAGLESGRSYSVHLEKRLQQDPPPFLPEPASLTLFGVGFAGMAFRRRRKRLAAR